jgi:hypothetical protein
MTAAQFSLLAATIFALVAMAQIVRAITRLPITIGRTPPARVPAVSGSNYGASDPSRFEEWCLLPFAEVDGVLQPKPVEAEIFRGYLREWAAA